MKNFKGMKLLTGLLSMMLIVGVGTSIALADNNVPMTVSYQGELANVDASSVTMTFYLFADDAGENTKWSQIITDVSVINGVVSTVLGDSEPITEGTLDEATHLGIKINNGPLMQPLSKLTSSIFAMRAAVADKLADGAVAFTLEHVEPGSIPAGALAENAVVSSNILDGEVTSSKTSVSVVKKYSAIGGVSKSFSLDNDDQGLILVSGEVTITLPHPEDAAGKKFTIKKTDNGLQRESGSPCNRETNFVTIKCGNIITDWFNDTKLIENRTNNIVLEYKNSYATFVSDGQIWYITESNPPVDIFNPVPGENGDITTRGQDIRTFPIPLDLTIATDCDVRSCEPCKKDLYYLPVFSRNNAYKLKTLENVINHGEPCTTSWITDVTNLSCDPSQAPTPYDPGDDDGFKVNVVVRDNAGNMSIYYPPGDNTAPEATDYFIDSRRDYNYIRLEWTPATDNKDAADNIKYSVYINKEGESSCLEGLDSDVVPTYGPLCENYSVALDETLSGSWVSNDEASSGKVYSDAGEYVMLILSAKDSEDNTYTLEPGTTYYFTVVAEDISGNKRQYTISDTTTSNN